MDTGKQAGSGGNINDHLAIERTRMANDRTLLSFIRTALYFAVAGLTVNQLLSLQYGKYFQLIFLLLAALLFGIGLVRYRWQQKRIRQSQARIGLR